MSSSVNLITPPVTEPISVLEARNHLRIMPDDAIPDEEIESIILVAREKIENEIHRALITQTWQAVYSAFPGDSSCPIKLEFPPLQSIVSVKYIDPDEMEQTWDSGLYQVNDKSTPGFILPVSDESYPDTGDVINAVKIEFVAGYGEDGTDVPSPLRHAMKLIIGELYVRREEAVMGAAITTVPLSVSNLISPYTIISFF